MKIISRKTSDIKIYTDNIEETALAQVKELGEHYAYVNSKIRIMPDCHAGAGCTIGTTMEITDKITPSLVGVDIGCGMLTVKLKDKEINLKELDAIINEFIPSGKNTHSSPVGEFPFNNLRRKYELNIERAKLSLGTLGGGNHFIEIDKGSDGSLYLVIHSGSRGIGNDIATMYQKTAIGKKNSKAENYTKLIKKLKAKGMEKEIEKVLLSARADKIKNKLDTLKPLVGEEFDDYLNDMQIMQEYASVNRNLIASIIIEKANLTKDSKFETIHNYIDFKRMMLRKGAVSAEYGEMLLIPINMRDGALLCEGKGNEDWNYSAPHGAGRLMSRTKAKAVLNMATFNEQMKGVYSTSVIKDTLDEAPDAYKPIDEIIENISDTVIIIDRLKPIYNFKAH